MESNNRNLRVNIVGAKELIAFCIYRCKIVTGGDLELIEFNDDELAIGIVESKKGNPMWFFKLGMIYQESRVLESNKWVIPGK